MIHYDPWWNPAAENQATDRAHRLGQDKPVFVYKLIAAGSIEEKIVALQERKAVLVNAILSEDAAGSVKFSSDDLDALFGADSRCLAGRSDTSTREGRHAWRVIFTVFAGRQHHPVTFSREVPRSS